MSLKGSLKCGSWISDHHGANSNASRVGEGQIKAVARKKERKKERQMVLEAEAFRLGIPVHQLIAEKSAESLRIKEQHAPVTYDSAIPLNPERYHESVWSW